MVSVLVCCLARSALCAQRKVRSLEAMVGSFEGNRVRPPLRHDVMLPARHDIIDRAHAHAHAESACTHARTRAYIHSQARTEQSQTHAHAPTHVLTAPTARARRALTGAGEPRVHALERPVDWCAVRAAASRGRALTVIPAGRRRPSSHRCDCLIRPVGSRAPIHPERTRSAVCAGSTTKR
jgi:hypothetical protein